MKPVGCFAGRCAWRLAAAGLLFAGRAHGQEAPTSRALVVKVLPQYLVMSGLWLEVEYRFKQHAQQGFALTPQLYAGPAGVTTGLTYMRTGQYYLNKGGEYADFFPEVLETAQGRSYVDYAFHLAPMMKKHIEEIPALVGEHGVTSFKVLT